MIELLRVDHRLLHGQVTFSWAQGLGADCILIANDDVLKNDIRKTTIKLAKPAGVKLVIKTIEDTIAALKNGITKKYKLFIVVENVENAYQLATVYPEIKEINSGRMKVRENTRNISKTINITSDEEKMIKELVANGCEAEIRQVPNDKKVAALNVLQKGEIQMIGQAILLGCIASIAQSEYALGTLLLSRPVVTGLFVGIVLGDVKTGVIMGAILELAFIGSFSVGTSIPPGVVTGGILGTAFAITAGVGAETTLVLGLPIATLMLTLKSIYLSLLIPIMSQKADQYAEEGAYKGMERMHLLVGFGLSFMLALIVTISFAVGSDTIKGLPDLIPEFIQHGLSVATGIIPALGFAILTRLLINKQVASYFFLGFVLTAYFKLPVTGVAILGTTTAVVVVNIMNYAKEKNEAIQTTSGEVIDGDEDF